MGALVLILLAAWIVLSIIGLVVKTLFWLFIVGLVLFIATVVWGSFNKKT